MNSCTSNKSSELPHAENYKIKMVQRIYHNTREERQKWVEKAHYNLFNLQSDQVFIDLLSDSGTGSMSDTQWAAMILGDESYAGSNSFHVLHRVINNIFGFDYVLPTHQGRAAENVLFSLLVKSGDFVPGNSFFDTTRGHIEYRKGKAVDCTISEAFNTTIEHPFKGNIDLKKLENYVSYSKEYVPMIVVTITCNTLGGQPVSMENLRQVKKIAEKYGVRVIYDSCRFAENAYFIKTREDSYKDATIRDIVREMFSYADGMTMSAKKDGLVNIGGFIALREKSLFDECSHFIIMFEGFTTYGGMSGRDMNAMAVGLEEVTTFEYLENRIKQVAFLGKKLHDYGIPLQLPIGGHAVFIDAKKFLPHVPKEEYIAQTLAVELYLEAGIRGVEIGTLMADRDPETKENRYPEVEFLRLAVPRRVYTNDHMNYVAIALKNIFHRRREIIHGFTILKEAPILRHFTIQLQKL
ncbi:LOW QUALITY PROTEIN: putative beta-eliminating lyase [Tachypleus tridentatus]|uniref:LOW QUALITY PROTEIN: putative beta-eliminating lyase n=1 Tax=Tachypleus tridentatus TaxID=6853 RepID=UPI003FD491FB